MLMAKAPDLRWKLESVLRGRAKPELLHTYSEKRQAVARAAAVAAETVVTAFVRRDLRVHTPCSIASGGGAIALIVMWQCAVTRRVVAP